VRPVLAVSAAWIGCRACPSRRRRRRCRRSTVVATGARVTRPRRSATGLGALDRRRRRVPDVRTRAAGGPVSRARRSRQPTARLDAGRRSHTEVCTATDRFDGRFSSASG